MSGPDHNANKMGYKSVARSNFEVVTSHNVHVETQGFRWLGDKDSNLDRQSQSLQSYR